MLPRRSLTPYISTYNAKAHPKFQSGELTEDDILGMFLKTFDAPDHADGQVYIVILDFRCLIGVGDLGGVC